jgi:hypothetical protein
MRSKGWESPMSVPERELAMDAQQVAPSEARSWKLGSGGEAVKGSFVA